MGLSVMFTFQQTLRGKYWWHPIAIIGVVDTFRPEISPLFIRVNECSKCYHVTCRIYPDNANAKLKISEPKLSDDGLRKFQV